MARPTMKAETDGALAHREVPADDGHLVQVGGVADPLQHRSRDRLRTDDRVDEAERASPHRGDVVHVRDHGGRAGALGSASTNGGQIASPAASVYPSEPSATMAASSPGPRSQSVGPSVSATSPIDALARRPACARKRRTTSASAGWGASPGMALSVTPEAPFIRDEVGGLGAGVASRWNARDGSVGSVTVGTGSFVGPGAAFRVSRSRAIPRSPGFRHVLRQTERHVRFGKGRTMKRFISLLAFVSVVAVSVIVTTPATATVPPTLVVVVDGGELWRMCPPTPPDRIRGHGLRLGSDHPGREWIWKTRRDRSLKTPRW